MKAAYNNKTGQYKLKFPPKPYLGEEDFWVTSCNENAYRAVKLWPNWQHFALNIFGPVSSGKTHLAHIWVRRIQQMLPRPIQIPILPAHSVNMKNLNKLVNDYPYLVIDNFDACVNEEAFFHLYNFYNVPERALLFISERPLAKLGIKLPDLRSRLSTIPQAEIFPPDDEMLTALVAKLFNDCQIVISQEILEYILFHVERSFSYISRLVAEIDDISWTLGRAVTIPMVRTAIRNIERGQQLELFV